MRRFAADGARRVLYYEERRKGSIVLAAIGMPEDGIPIDFVINLELLHKVDTTPHHFDLSSYHCNYSGRLLLARDTIRRAQTASFHAYLAPSQTDFFGQQTT